MVVVGAAIFSPPGTWAGEGDEPVYSVDSTIVTSVEAATAELIPNSTTETPIAPWVHTNMPPKVRKKLDAALELAGQRIREVPECRELFTGLGADGIEMLSTTLYFPIARYKDETVKCRNAQAFTYVGEAPTSICRDFSRLSGQRAAMVLVHEALHHAGLTEAPQDPSAMTSLAINVMVKKSCGF